jgi:hypothetical protein
MSQALQAAGGALSGSTSSIATPQVSLHPPADMGPPSGQPLLPKPWDLAWAQQQLLTTLQLDLDYQDFHPYLSLEGVIEVRQ